VWSADEVLLSSNEAQGHGQSAQLESGRLGNSWPSRPSSAVTIPRPAMTPGRAGGRPTLLAFLDALDRAGFTPMETLLLLRIASTELTVHELADELGRPPVAIRRAAARLVARGLLRRRSGGPSRCELVLTATPHGLDAVGRLGPLPASGMSTPHGAARGAVGGPGPRTARRAVERRNR